MVSWLHAITHHLISHHTTVLIVVVCTWYDFLGFGFVQLHSSSTAVLLIILWLIPGSILTFLLHLGELPKNYLFVMDDSGDDAMHTPARRGSYITPAADIMVLLSTALHSSMKISVMYRTHLSVSRSLVDQ